MYRAVYTKQSVPRAAHFVLFCTRGGQVCWLQTLYPVFVAFRGFLVPASRNACLITPQAIVVSTWRRSSLSGMVSKAWAPCTLSRTLWPIFVPFCLVGNNVYVENDEICSCPTSRFSGPLPARWRLNLCTARHFSPFIVSSAARPTRCLRGSAEGRPGHVVRWLRDHHRSV